MFDSPRTYFARFFPVGSGGKEIERGNPGLRNELSWYWFSSPKIVPLETYISQKPHQAVEKSEPVYWVGQCFLSRSRWASLLIQGLMSQWKKEKFANVFGELRRTAATFLRLEVYLLVSMEPANTTLLWDGRSVLEILKMVESEQIVCWR